MTIVCEPRHDIDKGHLVNNLEELNRGTCDDKRNSVQLVDALRQLHVPKTFVQTIDITLKYSYILGKHLHQQIECVQLRTVGQKVSLHLFGSLLGLLYLSTKNHTKEVYEAMLLRGYGMDRKQKEPFCWKKEDGLLLLELVFLIAVTTLLR